MNKLMMCWLFPLTLLSWQPQILAANSLDIEFNGELVVTTCQVAAESMNKKITLNNLRWQFINENVTSSVTPFSIEIDKCSDTDLQKSIKLTWQSNDLVTIGSDSFLSTKGDSGVVLGLVSQDEKPIIWNKPMKVGNIQIIDGVQQFNFGVFARIPATGEAKVGDFSSIVTFNVEYE